MCLITTELPKIAEEDIECYKIFEKKENHGFLERLSHLGLKHRIVSPYVETDFTFKVLTKGTIVAKGRKMVLVIPKKRRGKKCDSYEISFDEVKTYKNIDLYNNHIDYFEYTKGMIHAYYIPYNFSGYDCAYKCIIPKGTLYAKGYDGDICAEKIKIVERIF